MSGSFGGYEEHRFRRVISGDIETVRRRLSDVLEDFNYVVLGDNPIQAKRNPSKNILIATVLEYHTKLTIGLKQISEASTLAIFDYSVPYLFTRGDRESLEREAEAVIAVATASKGPMTCPGCGARTTNPARFCRSCGAPVAGNKLPELEIMRMTANTSAAQQEVFLGLLILLLTLAINLPLILSNGKAANVGWVLLALGAVFALLTLRQGVFRLRDILNPQNRISQSAEPDAVQLTAHETLALTAHPASVTEGTTELIGESVPARAPAQSTRNTDPIEKRET